jgi:tRNA(Ile)-lysidine synthase
MKHEWKESFAGNMRDLGVKIDSKPPQVAVALSGGIDSMALLYLTKEWMQDNFPEHSHSLTALIVDHKLRDNSTQQVQELGQYLKQAGINHEVLTHEENTGEIKTAENPYLSNNLEARARQVRYELLTGCCRNHNLDYLLLAHHLDDEIENFLIKLMRGSGLVGLSPARVTTYNDIKILRPLHNFRKQELYSYIKQNQLPYWHDHSNEQISYLRNNIRANLGGFLSNFGDPEFLKTRISKSLSNLGSSMEVIGSKFKEALNSTVTIQESGWAVVDLDKFNSQLNEIKFHLLSYTLTIIGGNFQTPRAARLEPLQKKLEDCEIVKNYTLHGTISNTIEGNKLLITREISRIKDVPKKLELGQNMWDNRFKIYFSDEAISRLDEELYIDILDKTRAGQFKHYCLDKNQQRGIQTIPCIKTRQKIVAIPHIFYYDDSLGEILKRYLHIEFSPSYNFRLLEEE